MVEVPKQAYFLSLGWTLFMVIGYGVIIAVCLKHSLMEKTSFLFLVFKATGAKFCSEEYVIFFLYNILLILL